MAGLRWDQVNYQAPSGALAASESANRMLLEAFGQADKAVDAFKGGRREAQLATLNQRLAQETTPEGLGTVLSSGSAYDGLNYLSPEDRALGNERMKGLLEQRASNTKNAMDTQTFLQTGRDNQLKNAQTEAYQSFAPMRSAYETLVANRQYDKAAELTASPEWLSGFSRLSPEEQGKFSQGNLNERRLVDGNSQWDASFARDNAQWKAKFDEDVRQHGLDYALRKDANDRENTKLGNQSTVDGLLAGVLTGEVSPEQAQTYARNNLNPTDYRSFLEGVGKATEGTGVNPLLSDTGNAVTATDAISTLFPGARITGGDRDPGRNAAVGGAPRSHHLQPGRAVDIAPIPGETVASVKKQLEDAGWTVHEALDETKKTNGTGPHWHFAMSPPSGRRSDAQLAAGNVTSGNTALAQAAALVDQDISGGARPAGSRLTDDMVRRVTTLGTDPKTRDMTLSQVAQDLIENEPAFKDQEPSRVIRTLEQVRRTYGDNTLRPAQLGYLASTYAQHVGEQSTRAYGRTRDLYRVLGNISPVAQITQRGIDGYFRNRGEINPASENVVAGDGYLLDLVGLARDRERWNPEARAGAISRSLIQEQQAARVQELDEQRKEVEAGIGRFPAGSWQRDNLVQRLAQIERDIAAFSQGSSGRAATNADAVSPRR